jgi:hypothetical protein
VQPERQVRSKTATTTIMKYIALLIFLLLVAISGCSVLQNSETYYLEHPRGAPIHWREYED